MSESVVGETALHETAVSGTGPTGSARRRVPVSATGLVLVRGGRRILDGVDVLARPGRVLAVTGPSGSGKSTLLSVLAGQVRPDEGEVRLGDRPVGEQGERDRRGTGSGPSVGMVLQGYGLLPVLTAAENVELPLQLRGVPRAQVRERAARALVRAGLGEVVEGAGDRLAEELSGGQQQRVAVARGLVVDPDVLLADEPTSELDAATRDVVVAALREEAELGATVVLATHDPEVAALCDAEIHLVDGRVASLRG